MPFDGNPGNFVHVATRGTPESKKRRRLTRPTEAAPTPSDLATAARDLHTKLTWVIGQLDALQRAGMAPGAAWSKLQFTERRSTRKRHPKVPSVVVAVRDFAERAIVDVRREMLGFQIANRSLELARGEVEAQTALATVRALRGDGGPKGAALHDLKTISQRSVPEKWKAAYRILAAGADVWPLPDTGRRGLRGDTKKLYEGIKTPPQRVLEAEYPAKRIEAERAARAREAKARDRAKDSKR